MNTSRLSNTVELIKRQDLLVCLTCSQAVRGRSLGTYRSGPLLSGTDTLALYWAWWHGQRGRGHSSADVIRVRRPFRERGAIMGRANRGQVGGRAQEGPSRTWATEEEVGKKVNSKIINKGEGRGGTVLIYRLYTDHVLNSLRLAWQRGGEKVTLEKRDYGILRTWRVQRLGTDQKTAGDGRGRGRANWRQWLSEIKKKKKTWPGYLNVTLCSSLTLSFRGRKKLNSRTGPV